MFVIGIVGWIGDLRHDTTPTKSSKVENEPCKNCQQTTTRRQFLNAFSIAVGGLAGLLAGVPVIGFVFAPLLNQQPGIWRPVGALEKFQVGSTVEVTFETTRPRYGRSIRRKRRHGCGVTANSSSSPTRSTARIWAARYAGNHKPTYSCVDAMAACTTRMAPVAAGPPPRPLVQYPVRINNGQVEIQTSPIPIT